MVSDAPKGFWESFLSGPEMGLSVRIELSQSELSLMMSCSRRLTCIESVMPSSHLILGRPLLLLPPTPPIYHGRMQHKNTGKFLWRKSAEERTGFDQRGRARYATWRRRRPRVSFHLIVMQIVFSTKRANL